MLRILKVLFHVVFSAHAIAFVFLGYVVRGLHGRIGHTMFGSFSFDDWLFGSCFLFLVLLLGWLAGTEFRGAQVRTLRKMLHAERKHSAAMHKMRMAMVDDVLLAARHGLPVSSFPYSGAKTEPKAAPRDLEADYIGRL
jgi:hypothetical protein